MSDLLSPLAGHAEPGLYGERRDQPGIVLQGRLPACLVQVGAWPETEKEVTSLVASVTGCAVSQRPAGSSHNERTAVLHLGAGRYLVESLDAGLAGRLGEQIDVERGCLVDLGHGRVAIRVAGDKASRLLAKGLAIDLDAGAFPPLQVAQGAIHEIGVIVRRLDAETFDLYVYRGFALSLWEWLTDAAAEFGYRVEPAPGP